jgi:serine/threonine protein kinase/Tfp pilus assembly protein PilF
LEESRAAQLIALFDRALEVPRERRTAFVERVCGDDIALRQELSSLVEAHESAPGYFDQLARDLVSPAFAAMIAADGSADGSADAASELRHQLQEAFGDEYAIERELSGAGMSRVFLAHEPRLVRKVVIKVVRPGLLGHVSAERFAREIRLAASLQQANIVPVLAAGTAAGLPYYTMPFVEGRSLSDRLAADGPLPIRDAMNVLRDVLRALAHAHSRGVVHRDIKPGNVLLSGGTAVVTDFGIARALGAAAEVRDGDALTQPGAGIGTPAYMAPEQATGDPSADHRADIYAFGCLAYAVFTGRPPFDLDAPHRIIAAHFNAAPSRLTTRRSDVPPAVAAVIARCLEKDPERRPQRAVDLLESFDAESIQLGSSATRHALLRPIIVAALVLISLSAIAAYATPRIRGFAHGSTAKAMHASQTTTAGTTNAAALDLYVVGRELIKRRGSGINQSVRNFERAIALDSTFAAAYAALATSLELYPYFVGTPPAEVRDRAVHAARHALALDSTLAEPHTALGWVYAHDGDWDSAHAEFRHAILLSPRDPVMHFNYGRFLINRGEAEEAMAHFEQALTADRTSPLYSAWISYAFFLQGKRDSALAESARAVQLDSALMPTRNLGAYVNLGFGRDSVARHLMAIAGPAGEMSTAAYVYAKLGDTANAWRLVRAMDAKPRPWFRYAARASLALGARDTAGALGALEQSSRESGSMWIYYIPLRDAAFDPVRATSRFAALARRAGLDANGIPTARSYVRVVVP